MPISSIKVLSVICKIFQHIAVFRKGIIYRMDVFDQTCKLMTPCMIEKQLQKIIDDADLHQGKLHFNISALYFQQTVANEF